MVIKRFVALLYGWITIFLLMLVSSFILALIIRFTDMGETILHWATFGLGIAYVFAGGTFAGIKGKEQGWMLGALTGLGYSLFIFLYQFLAYNQLFNSEQWLYHGLFLAAAVLGGITGVNFQANQE
ncbi:putative membrane protein, TIGR04086 family [Salinibacillus kushneri]|uniref:Putative membrane protein, TIGR04086 family n=1 Tax=Salinibacillus kushneri TaxID=237682 RepID=A0A1I0G8X1_9BACI|nr:TIGR04086 family membrane protein [Salinibacillus kushneri]SET67195.1 putative membrane protein, TIGR04086 family [Salinibacillus kushneri]